MIIAMKRKLLLIIYILCCAVAEVRAGDGDTLFVAGEDTPARAGTVSAESERRGLSKVLASVLGFFSPEPDSNYIESQKYNFTAMAQMTNTDDHFVLTGEKENSITFSPQRKTKVGPFFGWRWLFFGYTFNLNSLDIGHSDIDINTSIYTPAVGIDLLYRKMGGGYKIREFSLEGIGKIDTFNGLSTNSLDIDIFSLNLYYALNSRRYSHQAVFNQTNRQIRSAGSWIVGTGYNQCRVTMDWVGFHDELRQKLPTPDISKEYNDSALFFKSLSYRSLPLTVGYGYNLAFGKNWSAGLQLLASLSYIWSKGDAYDDRVFIDSILKDFSFSNFTFDGTIRLGVVWNNSRWFAGANAIYHTYHYHQSHLEANNIFGTINFYVGFNFWRR